MKIDRRFFLGLVIFLIPLFSFAEFDVQDATNQYLNQLTPEQTAKSNAYFEGGYWIQLWNLFYGIAVAAILLFSGLSAKMRDLSERLTRFSFVHNFLFAIQYFLLSYVLSFPLSVYLGHIREHQYDLSNLSFAGWLGESLKGLGIGIIIGGLFVAVIYKIVKKMPKTWWLAGSVVGCLFLMFISFIFPVFLAPVFNDYKPLPEGEVRDAILSMARANGIAVDNVYQFDASKQSKRISANVSGLWGTMRISLNDNLLNRSTKEEIMAVMGHEMGHYVLNHVYKSTIFFTIILLMAFYFLYWSMGHLFTGYWKQWGVRDEYDIALLPFAMSMISVFFFIFTPISNSIVRSAESEADIFGLNAARQPDGFASTAIKLSEYRKLDPGPWEEVIFFDHPSGRARVEMAMRWKKENLVEEDSSKPRL
ncbi:MAG: M48 family metallopeptidase [Bdellovibrionales bacterium]|nr:M48 family metallopeptidase [Bdellovibrionales bacterium]